MDEHEAPMKGPTKSPPTPPPLSSAAPPSSTGSTRSGAQQTDPLRSYFTADDFTTLFSSLVNSTFIQFGSALVRQLKGIPMGISPAPFIANLYLASFEFRFLQQYPSTTAAAQATLRRFRHSKR
ncbi:hypothetical protein GPECTOR_58g532 [Gonium pectorale]|uniref:Uncharacterized protein n=1 Tax=Gonium pectorale TaxID=33097 RepID=A0A150G5I8_GONPE|nr:hypothetical protein GPECTOR_58g532 [Gonium pectorale]|eukprot:KXZ45084.1 hypothetical protein GPECTOR_58g532 [Gonium pectorale]